MYIRAIELQGFRDLPDFSARELDRVVTVKGPGPHATALGDALDLFFSSLSGPGLVSWMRRTELLGPDEAPDLVGEPHPEQVSWLDRLAAGAQVREGERDRRVTVEFELDPVLFRLISDNAGREPRLLTALGGGASIRIGMGYLLAGSMDAMAINLAGFEVGGERFPTAESDRPPWMRQVLKALMGRFRRAGPASAEGLARRVMERSLSRGGHAAFLAWQQLLRPHLGLVRPALGPGGLPILLADDLPLRRLGPGALARASLAADAWLHECDVLWVDEGEAWVDGAVEGAQSPVEQVFRVDPAGALDPRPKSEAPLALRHRGPGIGKEPEAER